MPLVGIMSLESRARLTACRLGYHWFPVPRRWATRRHVTWKTLAESRGSQRSYRIPLQPQDETMEPARICRRPVPPCTWYGTSLELCAASFWGYQSFPNPRRPDCHFQTGYECLPHVPLLLVYIDTSYSRRPLSNMLPSRRITECRTCPSSSYRCCNVH